MTEHSEIRLDHFMAAANAAYYAHKDPFADFVTAPEISQIFGELIAVWIISVMRSMQDSEVALIEAGPGRGTLMADILRILRQVALSEYNRCKVYLIERSPRLRQIQQEALKGHQVLSIEWLDSVDQLPALPVIFVANEFLDALPIRQFIRKGETEWAEYFVSQDQRIERPLTCLPESPVFNRPVPVGDIVEVCEAGQCVIKILTMHICQYGGIGLLIDYGYAGQLWGDTLQAIAHGKKVSPFVPAGEADLTFHVDFSALQEIATAAGGRTYGIQTQGEFLKQLGIVLRAGTLMKKATSMQKQEIASAVQRLIDPAEMGDLFKVMVIAHPDLPEPPAFEYCKKNS